MIIENEETKIVKQFIIILLIVLLIATGLYFLTKKLGKKDSSSETKTEEKSSYIDPTIAIVGTMLKKTTDEYYVILYSRTDENAIKYANLEASYKRTKKAKKVYFVDLSNAMNAKYVATQDEQTNTTSSNLDELKFGEITLLKVKDNKIAKSYESVEAINKEWKLD